MVLSSGRRQLQVVLSGTANRSLSLLNRFACSSILLCFCLSGPLSQLLAHSALHEGSRDGATGVSSAHVQTLQDVAGVVSNDAVVGDWQ